MRLATQMRGGFYPAPPEAVTLAGPAANRQDIRPPGDPARHLADRTCRRRRFGQGRGEPRRRRSLAVPVGLPAAPPPRPNVGYILADDLGYGDVHCFNPGGKIPTPNLDRLAAADFEAIDVLPSVERQDAHGATHLGPQGEQNSIAA